MMALGSLEYQFPCTASDTHPAGDLHRLRHGRGQTTTSHKIRASVGTGIRMLIPQMGPIPLGFDLAFPISYADGDRLRYFNFSMSAMY